MIDTNCPKKIYRILILGQRGLLKYPDLEEKFAQLLVSDRFLPTDPLISSRVISWDSDGRVDESIHFESVSNFERVVGAKIEHKLEGRVLLRCRFHKSGMNWE